MIKDGVTTADDLVEPSYGLFSAARVQEHGDGDSHWVDGYFVESTACGINAQSMPLCTAAGGWTEIFDNSASGNFFHVAPFGILELFECENSIGYYAIDRRKTAVDHLEAVTEFAVEQELWLGTNAQQDTNPIPAERWLAAATDVTTTPGTALKPRLALALVEDAFYAANPGVQATIHMTPLIAAVLGDGVFTPDDGKLVTTGGSVVAINRSGNGAVGPVAGGGTTKHWIYATGPVHVDLGVEKLITSSASEIVNVETNTVTYAAERPAAVYFDGCAWFGVLADATL